MTDNRVQPQHTQRHACVYVRQSTMHQVRDHKASAEVQYDLVARAVSLGWQREAVKVYDGDLGVTASVPSQRESFQQLVADVGLGRIGIVLGFDVTRLARNNADWYRLLDLCGICDTLIADSEGIYDPAVYNDRLLLGLKGTMSEAEHHFIRTRLLAGVEKKAAAGTLRKRLPVGLDYDQDGREVITANEAVRKAIELVFERFIQYGSAHRTYRSLQCNELLLPARRFGEKEIRWVAPRYGAVVDILRNPHYAGAYAYGRHRVQRVVDEAGQIHSRVQGRRRREWKVLIKNHHPGYITWEQFEDIQRRLRGNARPRAGEASSVVREGRALLAGLVRCGRCGRRMVPTYACKSGDSIRYECNRLNRVHGGAPCESFAGTRLQDAVVNAVLEALSPASMQITVAALEQMDAEEDALLKQLEHRFEQARYEADRARRRYEAVEPENRLVARTLESDWNRQMHELAEVEQQLAERRHQLPPPLSPDERGRLLELGLDLRRVWGSPTTTPQERKQLLRTVLDDVVVHVDRAAAKATVRLVWQGSAVTELEVQMRRTGHHDRVADAELIEDVRRMAQSLTDAQIANALVRRRIRTPTGLPYNAARVEGLRRRHQIAEYVPELAANDEPAYTAQQVAEKLGVKICTVLRWLKEGFLSGEQAAPCAPWRIQLGQVVQLKVAERAPKGWLPPKAAAKALGVSRATVLHWVQSGKLAAVMAGRGRRSGLRIDVSSSSCRKQQTLFDQPSAQGGVQ
jgi:excisionase family DNA binding protein